MFKVSIDPHWRISRTVGTKPGVALNTDLLLRLLAAIQSSGSIAAAVKVSGLSYRHVWGLLMEAEQLFNAKLLIKQPGKGTRLSPLAETLLWADKRISARLSPTLQSLASELEAELDKTVLGARSALRIDATHGFAVAALLDQLTAANVPVELRYRNSTEAVAALARREFDLAGFHVPLGEFEAEAVKRYAKWLNADQHVLIHLAVRNQGFFVAAGNPKNIRTLADLQRSDVRFVNRQPGSGTRLLLELMLEKQGISTSSIRGYESAEFTHAAVAAYIASDMADVGVGVETAAKRFGLDFVPLIRERYFFAADKQAIEKSPLKEIVSILQSEAFRQQLSELAGYEGSKTGLIMEVSEAFAL